MDIQDFLKKIDWRHVAILGFIFLLAFGIRAYLFKYDLMFEFDTYWHTRMTAEIIQNGVPPTVDPLAYTHLPNGSPIPMVTILFWYVGAAFYSVAALLFTGSLAYNKEFLIQVVKFLPAFYGALTCLVLYFIGKEAYDRKTGYVMAFFGAVSASFIYRTMAGFYEAGTLGHVVLVLGILFLVRAAKRLDDTRGFALNIAAAGVVFGILSYTYGIFQIVPLLLGFFLIFFGLEVAAKKGFRSAGVFVGGVIGAFVIFYLATLVGQNADWLNDVNYLVSHSVGKVLGGSFGNLIVPLIILVLLIGVAILLFFSIRKKGKEKATETDESFSRVLQIGKVVLLVLILVGTVILTQLPKTQGGVAASSVGEESPGYLYFAHKFNALIILPILMLILIPLVEFKRKSIDPGAMILFAYVLLSFYMAWDRLHYSFNFGVPIAIAAGYVFYHTLLFFNRRDKTERQVIGVALLFLVLVGVSSATLFTQQNTPNIEENTGWKEGLLWLSKNTPKDAKMFNWWDEGHWISFVGERKVITDNRNFDQKANSAVGVFSTTSDLNEALGLLKKYDSDYLLLGSDLFAKRNSMILYAYYLENPVPPQGDARFDNVQSFTAPCGTTTESGVEWVNCAGNRIPKNTFQTIPTAWTDKPTTIEDQRNPIFLYRSADSGRLIKLSAKVNSTVFAKVWLHAPEMANLFEEVYPNNVSGATEKEFKVFKIKKENFS
ncbi:MAG: hypothetical protein J4215_02065 [Candidatus Diapherotrites archaeon]|uniref:dolichyl-phosphooligosaccharide-protein glycotransferase n=1 Tax=Candidatus Iainarchaeum sp. TaxID=3101447 RepID=A0A8T4L4B4_9ARCH|nr:hypothetical protein [Candidatus Diapherotrites archaeon]